MSPRLLHYSDLESAFDYPERIGRLAGTIDALRDEETLVVGTGDNTSPGVLAMFTEGEHALDFFAAVEPDADTFGNHDFDFGLERTREIVAESPQTWLGTNVFLDGDRFGSDAGGRPLAARRGRRQPGRPNRADRPRDAVDQPHRVRGDVHRSDRGRARGDG